MARRRRTRTAPAHPKSRFEKWGLPAAVATGVVGLLLSVTQTGLLRLLGWDQPEASSSPSAAAATTPTGDPLRVTKITPIPRREDFSWLLPSPIDAGRLARMNQAINTAGGLGSKGADAIMREFGAIDATTATVEIELEGNRAKPVRIIDIEAVARCRQPLTGTLFYGPPQGRDDTVKLGFDLDSPSPVAQEVRDNPSDGPPLFVGDYFADHKYTVAQDEQVTFRLSARTFKKSCDYEYKFELIVDGKATHQMVDDNGRPFTVSALIDEDRTGLIRCSAYRSVYVRDSIAAGGSNTEPQPWTDSRRSQYICD